LVAAESISHFIGGRHARSAFLKTFGVIDPATGKEYAQVAVGLAADINQAVLAAQAALEAGPWPEMAAPDRAALLNRIADAIGERDEDIADAEALGTGLPVTQARELAARAAGHFRLAADQVTTQNGDKASQPPGQGGYAAARPAGVAGLIAPWRTPFLAQAQAVAPALASGCTVVLKPDEWAPVPAMLLAEISTVAGLPAGVLNVVHGARHPRAPGTQARDALIAHPKVTRVWFAGEADAGQRVMLDAAAHRKHLCAEIAGSSPCIIFADADLDQAADAALFGAFSLSGQRATATSAILAHRPVYDALVSRLADRARRIRVGAPADPATEIGPLVHTEHHDKLTSWVRAAVRDDARLAAGGRPPAGLAEGNYLAPTVLADVTPSMQIFGEHLCGPVACVAPFDTDKEAVSLAAVVTYPRAAYIWTQDLQRAHSLASALDCADIWVNSRNPQDLQTAPAGHRPGGPRADARHPSVDFYTRSQTVYVAADDTPVPRFGA
jgi:5-carboxymethyl-2-hydroxymuconic-semialdehyde dehydrogenase